MIRIIKEIFVSPTTETPGIPGMVKLPMIPASGTLEIKEQNDENGRYSTTKLSFRCRSLSPVDRRIIRDGCIVRVVFSKDGCTVRDLHLGTEDIPVRFETEDSLDYLTLSTTHKSFSWL